VRRNEVLRWVRAVTVAGIAVAAVVLAGLSGWGADASVVATFDLGLGARAVGMGGAFVGLADDGASLFYNTAGLAWLSNSSVLSSYESLPGAAAYGQVSVALPHFGAGVTLFDFGEVPATDEYGNIIGSFSYRDYAFVAGVGATAADLPFVPKNVWAERVALGLSAKFLAVSTLNPGSGRGFALDVSLLMRADASGFVSGYGLGVVAENAFGIPIRYGSGHEEEWRRKLKMGMSVDLRDRVVLAFDVTTDKTFCAGAEWTPIPLFSLRSGVEYDGLWRWSYGIGARLRSFTFDCAVVTHPYMDSQFRGSFCVAW
jgi:hypothetical protein